MDPHTLETLGVDLLGGNVKAGASFNLGKAVNKLSGEYFSVFICLEPLCCEVAVMILFPLSFCLIERDVIATLQHCSQTLR